MSDYFYSIIYLAAMVAGASDALLITKVHTGRALTGLQDEENQ